MLLILQACLEEEVVLSLNAKPYRHSESTPKLLHVIQHLLSAFPQIQATLYKRKYLKPSPMYSCPKVPSPSDLNVCFFVMFMFKKCCLHITH